MKKALLIGINYNGTDSQLQGCINDVYNMKQYLLDYCGYQFENIKVLTDNDIRPTRKNIELNIRWLVSNCLPGDTLVFHYSGHGSNVRDTSNDETDGKDEVLVPLDYNTNGFIVDDWLFTNLVSIIPKQVNLFCFIDSCHSGTVLDLKHNYKSLCKLKTEKLEPNMKYKSEDWSDVYSYSIEKSKEIQGNVCMFSGALDVQYAEDAFINNKPQGAFTYCLLECLKNNLITLEDGKQRFKPNTLKLRHILKTVNCLLSIYKYSQYSQLSVSNKADLEVTLNL